jgi:hypothetical protein
MRSEVSTRDSEAITETGIGDHLPLSEINDLGSRNGRTVKRNTEQSRSRRIRSKSLCADVIVTKKWKDATDPAELRGGGDREMSTTSRQSKWRVTGGRNGGTKFPFCIADPPKSATQMDWVMSGASEEESEAWMDAIVHNCAVVDERVGEYQGEIQPHKQWNVSHTAQAKMALSMVMTHARRGS